MLDQLDTGAVQEVADRYLSQDIKPFYKEYITDRIVRYQKVLEVVRKGAIADVFQRALVLWDQNLFFEVHEVLEHAWHKATGDEKKILQAMIRAAGVYIKREYGYTEAAQKMANRALPVLMEEQNYLARYFDPARLIEALQNLELEPPLLFN